MDHTQTLGEALGKNVEGPLYKGRCTKPLRRAYFQDTERGETRFVTLLTCPFQEEAQTGIYCSRKDLSDCSFLKTRRHLASLRPFLGRSESFAIKRSTSTR
ncbi:MAG: hypothetical protein ACETV0_03950 [Nitrososphaeria archaeon]